MTARGGHTGRRPASHRSRAPHDAESRMFFDTGISESKVGLSASCYSSKRK